MPVFVQWKTLKLHKGDVHCTQTFVRLVRRAGDASRIVRGIIVIIISIIVICTWPMGWPEV